MRRWVIAALAALLTLSLAAGCSTSTRPSYGTVRVSLTDAPAGLDSVILDLREVAIHIAGPDDAGWTTFVPDSGRLDLLRLNNGVFAPLGTVLAQPGHYTQVRLLLGPGSYAVVNGVVRPLDVPSGQQTGLKLIGPFDVVAGTTVDLGVEIDASRSLHETGNGRLMLRPTAKVMVLPQSGAIAGVIQPAAPPSAVYALLGADTLGTAVPGANGAFVVPVLPPGAYTLAIDAPAAYRDTSLAGVVVAAGSVTNVGTVTLTPQ